MFALLGALSGCGGAAQCSPPTFACPITPVASGAPFSVNATPGTRLGQSAVVTIDGNSAHIKSQGDDLSLTITPPSLPSGSHTLRIDTGACYSECDFAIK